MTLPGRAAQIAGVRPESNSNGELTERGFARSVGISQPHVHNVLKGVRNLSPGFLRYCIKVLSPLSARSGPLERTRSPSPHPPRPTALRRSPIPPNGPVGPRHALAHRRNPRKPTPCPSLQSPRQPNLVMARLMADPSMPSTAVPRYRPSRIPRLSARPMLAPHGLFVVERGTEAGIEAVIRYIRPGAQRYYLATDSTLDTPADWEPFPVSPSELVAAVKARVRWIGSDVTGSEWSHQHTLPQRGRFLYEPISW